MRDGYRNTGKTGSTTTAIETLEPRRLFAATAALAEDGQLTVTGTDGRDAVVVSLDPADATRLVVKLGRNTEDYALADVRRIVVDAKGGNDRVTVREQAGPVYVGLVVDGGAGNDAIATGSGNDVLDGGAGNDQVNGGSGDDYITGGEGNDRLLGGDDNDQLDAGAGRDRVAGGVGDDNLDGGDGRDAVKAGDGDDRVASDAGAGGDRQVRLLGDGTITSYDVTTVDDLPPELIEVLGGIETELPGFQVVRAEAQADANLYSVYYRFGSDPDVYVLVVSVIGGELELVTRQVSLAEARDVARAAFDGDVPNAGVVSLFQHPGNVWDVRYRDPADGSIRTATTDDIIWGIDDLESDQDNDGRRDPHEGPAEG